MVLGPDILNEVGTLSYVGVFIVSLLANFVIPIPEEIILLALGYAVGVGILNGYIILPIAVIGLLISDIALFIASKRGSRIVQWLYKTFFAKRLAKKGTGWVHTNIAKIIVISRFLVQFRFLGPFLAGERKISVRRFVEYDLFALIIYVPLYVLLGAFFHSKVRYIIDKVGVARNIIFIVVVILVLIGLFKFIYRLLFRRTDGFNETIT